MNLETAIQADRAYLNGFLQACREFAMCLEGADAQRMNKRCAEQSEQLQRNLRDWGVTSSQTGKAAST
jgi:hypothetical protein